MAPTKMQENIFRVEMWVGILSSAALFGFSIYTAYFAYGAVQVPTYIAALAFILICFGLYGRRVFKRGSQRAIYFYGLFVTELSIILMVTLGLLQINVNRGIGYVEENWYQIQTAVLPFTTELNTKRGISNNCDIVMYLGIITFLAFVPVIVRCWMHLGGWANSARPAMVLPFLLPQFVLSAIVIVFGLDGIELTSFASQASSFDMALASVAAVGHFLVASVCFTAAIRKPDNAGAYISGSVLGLPFAIISIAVGVNLFVQQGTVRDFVTNNWVRVLQMVPSEYQQLSKNKYIIDSQNAFNFTAWLGLVLGFVSFLYVMFSACAGYELLKLQAKGRAFMGHRYTSYTSAGGNDLEDRNDEPPPTPPPPHHGVSLRPSQPVLYEDSEAPDTPNTSSSPLKQNLAGTNSTPLVPSSGTRRTVPQALSDHFKDERKACLLTSTIGMIVFISGIALITAFANDKGKCGVVVRSPEAGHVVYNMTYPNADAGYVEVTHSYPKGSVTILYYENKDNNDMELTLQLFGRDGTDVATKGNVNPLATAVKYDGNGHYTITLDPMLLQQTPSDCVSAALTVNLPAGLFRTDLDVTTTSGYNNLTCFSTDIVFQPFGRVRLNSTSGSIFAGGDSLIFGEILQVFSDSGRVRLHSTLGPFIHAETTDADLIAINCTSVSVLGGDLGDVTLRGHGGTNVIVTDAFAAYNATLSVEAGDVIGVVAGVVIEYSLEISSATGNVFLNNFIMASGAVTYITTTTGEIKIAAMTCNRGYLTTTSGDISVYEMFIGMLPISAFHITYPPPQLTATTQSGSISALGTGATPTSQTFKSLLSMYFTTDTGSIEVEVNGGGYVGKYEVSSKGDQLVSVNGNLAGPKGQIAYGGSGIVSVKSNTGDVSLAVLPGPLGL